MCVNEKSFKYSINKEIISFNVQVLEFFEFSENENNKNVDVFDYKIDNNFEIQENANVPYFVGFIN